MTKGNLRRRPNRATLATALSVLLFASVGLAEEDHLLGFTVKDLEKIAPGGPYTLGGDNFGIGKYATQAQGCELKKAKFLLAQADKNGGDDINGGPPGDFICYKAKCAGAQFQAQIPAEDQFGFHTLTPKKPKLVCAPFVAPGTPRFVDNGDGTVTDRQTRLTWEKKDDLGGIHDKDNTYDWSASGTDPDGAAFVDFLGTLNNNTSSDGTTISGCFAGHCDWRLPTIAELQTIVDLSAPGCALGSPCSYAALGPTVASYYWSSTTTAGFPDYALEVWFYNAVDGSGDKVDAANYVRAVRGGS